MAPREYTSAEVVICLSARLLRGHVARRAENRARLRQPAVATGPLGETEIGDVGRVVAVEQNVRWLEIAVQDAALVGEMDGPGDGYQLSNRSALHHQVGGTLPNRGETTRVGELHRKIGQPAVFADLVDGQDIGVIEIGGGFGFRAESLHVRGRGQLAGQDHFHCDDPVERYLPSAIDDAHAAPGNLFEQFVIPKLARRADRRDRFARRQRRWRHRRQRGRQFGVGARR